MFTSGTTGYPKPVRVSLANYAKFSIMPKAYKFEPDAVIYCSLPLYHGNATSLIVYGSCIAGGRTVVLRKRFSASNFWKDCIKYDCTGCFRNGSI